MKRSDHVVMSDPHGIGLVPCAQRSCNWRRLKALAANGTMINDLHLIGAVVF